MGVPATFQPPRKLVLNCPVILLAWWTTRLESKPRYSATPYLCPLGKHSLLGAVASHARRDVRLVHSLRGLERPFWSAAGGVASDQCPSRIWEAFSRKSVPHFRRMQCRTDVPESEPRLPCQEYLGKTLSSSERRRPRLVASPGRTYQPSQCFLFLRGYTTRASRTEARCALWACFPMLVFNGC